MNTYENKSNNEWNNQPSTQAQIPPELTNLPPEALNKMAVYYEHMAEIFRKRASKIDEFKGFQERSNKKIDELQAMPALVLSRIAQGEDKNSVMEAVAIENNVTILCVQSLFDLFMISKKECDMKERDKTIIKMVGLGLNYQTIAERLKIHHNTVTRAVKRELGCVLSVKDKLKIRKSLPIR